MRQYAEEHDILSKPTASMLVGSFSWCQDPARNTTATMVPSRMGLVVESSVPKIIEYEPNPCFRRFWRVPFSTARRAGDEDP